MNNIRIYSIRMTKLICLCRVAVSECRR